jgi:hypothetical protein
MALARFWLSNNASKKKHTGETGCKETNLLCFPALGAAGWAQDDSNSFKAPAFAFQLCALTPRSAVEQHSACACHPGPSSQFSPETPKTLLRTRNPQGTPRWPLSATWPHCYCHTHTHTHTHTIPTCYLGNPVATTQLLPPTSRGWSLWHSQVQGWKRH